MNKDRVENLAIEIAEFVHSRVNGIDFSLTEVSHALGEALAMIVTVPLLKELKEMKEKVNQPEDEDEEEEEEEEFKYLSPHEKAYAYHRLSSVYPHEIVCLIGQGKMRVPGWLQKEIVAKRKRA